MGLDTPDKVLDYESINKKKGRLYKDHPEGDEKYDNGHRDWRIYNPEKYHDPKWSPDKE